uniref:Uncharacterized protein n=1 Tax=Amphimedon queenslandica TaxID=400682 RepID=A0A1X7TWE5_AMPQE
LLFSVDSSLFFNAVLAISPLPIPIPGVFVPIPGVFVPIPPASVSLISILILLMDNPTDPSPSSSLPPSSTSSMLRDMNIVTGVFISLKSISSD